jgi:hypothetical protein
MSPEEFAAKMSAPGVEIRTLQNGQQWVAFLREHDYHALYGVADEGVSLWKAWCDACSVGVQWARSGPHLEEEPREKEAREQREAETPARTDKGRERIAALEAQIAEHERWLALTFDDAAQCLTPYLKTPADLKADIAAMNRVLEALGNLRNSESFSMMPRAFLDALLRALGLSSTVARALSFEQEVEQNEKERRRRARFAARRAQEGKPPKDERPIDVVDDLQQWIAWDRKKLEELRGSAPDSLASIQPPLQHFAHRAP